MAKKYQHKKETNAITFFRCDKCGNNLLATEAAYGTSCGKCLLLKKGINTERIERPPKITIDDLLAEINSSDRIPLDKKTVPVGEKMYTYETYTDSTMLVTVEVTNADGLLIFCTGADDVNTEEGIDVYLHLRENKYVTQPNFKKREK